MARFNARTYYLAVVPWLFLAIVLGSICATEEVNASRKRKWSQREFDYFVLALQWPGTCCRRTRHCCSSNSCCRGSKAPTEFTIRGLWPDYNDGSWPAYCSQSNFDLEKISTLAKVLELYWPPLNCGSPSSCNGGRGSFWAHEWEKHGACSFPVIQDEYNYFLRSLIFYFQYNVTGVLNDAGFIPSNTIKYPLGGIISAIENAFHASPLIVCKNGYVEEVRVCISKESELQNCTRGSSSKIDMVTSKVSCPKYVSLPPADVSLGAPVFYLTLLGALVVFTVAFLHVTDIYLHGTA